MKTIHLLTTLGLVMFLESPALAFTDRPVVSGVLSTLLYSTIGLIMTVLAYKVIDLLTPGDIGKEIAENKNVALAILVGSMILGVCIIIAAAIV